MKEYTINMLERNKTTIALIMNLNVKQLLKPLVAALTMFASTAAFAVGEEMASTAMCEAYTVSETWFHFGGLAVMVFGLLIMAVPAISDIIGGKIAGSTVAIGGIIVVAGPTIWLEVDSRWFQFLEGCPAVTGG